MNNEINIKELIKDNVVTFLEYKKGYLYYQIRYQIGTESYPTFSGRDEERPIYTVYKFPVPISDIGDATFKSSDEAIYFMRYINNAIKEGSFVNYEK